LQKNRNKRRVRGARVDCVVDQKGRKKNGLGGSVTAVRQRWRDRERETNEGYELSNGCADLSRSIISDLERNHRTSRNDGPF